MNQVQVPLQKWPLLIVGVKGYTFSVIFIVSTGFLLFKHLYICYYIFLIVVQVLKTGGEDMK